MKRSEQIGKRIKPEYRTDYEEIISDVAKESVYKTEVSPKQEPQEPDKEKKKTFLSRLRNRFMAMTFAGFITLGGAWQEGYADQLKIARQEGRAPKFVLESPLNEKSLREFEEKLKKEEPEFIKWLNDYEREILLEIDKYENSILGLTDEDDKRAEESIISVIKELESYSGQLDREVTEEAINELKNRIERDHRFIKFFKARPDFLKKFNQKIKDNLHAILISAVFLDNSSIAREELMLFNNSPLITFVPHSSWEQLGMAVNAKVKERRGHGGQVENDVELVFLPGAFSDREGNISENYYVDVFIHELIHALEIATENKKALLMNQSDFSSILTEGLTQSRTLEASQYLMSQNVKLKIELGRYDDRVVIVALIEAICRYHYKNPDLLSQWHTGVIEDIDFLEKFREALKTLGLDESIADDLNNLRTGFHIRRPGQPEISTRLLANLLGKLNLSKVKLSKKFIGKILSSGRSLNDRELKHVNSIVSEWFDLYRKERAEMIK